ncbi:MAG: putative RDD family membrane protein YckC [Hyphomicrobiaceae bacterium]|jgi:uncharacterized RDD family membrane protein YckC
MDRYAKLPARVNAGTIDALLLLALFLGAPLLLADAPASARVALMYGPLLFLEPVLIRVFGCTVGQAFMGLRVATADGDNVPSLPTLIVRYWLKAVLGLFSAAYLFFNRQRQALHDHVCGSVVVVNTEYPSCPLPMDADPALPPASLRFAVFLLWYCLIGTVSAMLIYGLAGLIITQLGTVVFEGEAFASFVDLLMTATAATLLLLLGRAGVAGRLPGARLAPSPLSE